MPEDSSELDFNLVMVNLDKEMLAEQQMTSQRSLNNIKISTCIFPSYFFF